MPFEVNMATPEAINVVTPETTAAVVADTPSDRPRPAGPKTTNVTNVTNAAMRALLIALAIGYSPSLQC